MTRHILILAGDTDGNLGDLAIVSATCEALRASAGDLRISLVTGRADRDTRNLRIEAIPRGLRGTLALIGAVRRADLVLCGGGGLFQDDDSLVKMPYWALRLGLVRLFNRQLHGFSIGAGPLRYASSRTAAKLALRTLRSVSARDRDAVAVLQPLTDKPVALVPDPAHLLAPARKQDARQCLRNAGIPLDHTPLLGVALRRWFHKDSDFIPYKYAARLGLRRNRGRSKMATFVTRIAAVLDAVVAHTQAHVVFMPTYNVGHEDDAAVCRDVARNMKTASNTVLELQDPQLYKAVTGLCSAMLCGRMHPAILAAGEGTPVIGLSYNRKFERFFEMIGLPQHCFPMDLIVASDVDDPLRDAILTAIEQPGTLRPATAALAESTKTYLGRLLESPMMPEPPSGQRAKLNALLVDAIRNVPFYRALYGEAGIGEDEFRKPDALQRLPIVTKSELLAAPAERRLNARFSRTKLVEESTTGSTGQPFTLCLDRRYVRRRNLRFLRALWSAGYRPWQRLMLLTDRHKAGVMQRGLRYYVSVEQDVDAMTAAFLRVRPAVLYGFTTPLRLVAERVAGGEFERPRLVVTTAEVLDRRTRDTLEEAFGCAVRDFYGLTEAGLVAWQKPGARGYALASDSNLVEFLPTPAGDGRYRVIVTNLELRASPIIRFDTGDLASLETHSGERIVTAFEGRRIDSIACRDGTRLSPYQVTDAMRDIPGLKRFKVTQRSLTAFLVEVETDGGVDDCLRSRIGAIFERLLGAGLDLEFCGAERLIRDGAAKFRPVESRVGLS